MKFCKQNRHFAKNSVCTNPLSSTRVSRLSGASGSVRDSFGTAYKDTWQSISTYLAKYLHIFGKVSPHVWQSIWTYFFSSLLGVINRKIAIIPYRYCPINQIPPHFAQITIQMLGKPSHLHLAPLAFDRFSKSEIEIVKV